MIDGNMYEVPDMGTFTMDEAQTLYDYSGLGLEDFASPEDESDDDLRERERKLRNPGFLRALMHIAYQRGNPAERPTRVKALIGGANIIAALENLAGEEPEAEDDGLPPVLTIEPERSSLSGSIESDGSRSPSTGPSGLSSGSGSDVPASLPTPTTATRSAISSISHLGSSAR